MFLYIKNNVQSDNIHLFKRTLWCFQNTLEDLIDFLWGCYALRCGKQRFTLDGRPDPCLSATLPFDSCQPHLL